MVIRKLQKTDFDKVFSMMRVFYASDALLVHPEETILRKTLADAMADSPYLEGFGFEEEQALQSLKEAGKVLIVATSKPEHMAKKILAHFNLDGYFDDICGSCDDSNRNEKDEVIRYALEKHGITDLDDVLMVGDRKFDVIGASKCGLQCMGVLYGFGDREELESAGAAYIAETVEEMARIIVSL